MLEFLEPPRVMANQPLELGGSQGVQPLPNAEALNSIELQCRQQLDRNPLHPGCANGLAQVYATIVGDRVRASQWSALYESRR
ncbi:MAG TPA: hypothetical protein VNV86_15385 [Candidatus Acidoferrum sp.]|nr:hypothetical protein [Candidatus Acidoferrum sp.]